MRTIITTICTSAALCALLLTATTTCHAQTNTRETTKNGHFIVKKRLIDKNTSAQQSAAVIACGGAQVAIDTIWQDAPKSTAAKDNTAKKKVKIWGINETFAQFRNGNKGWVEWVKENMRYPEEAKENGVQGRVLVTFLVYPDGTTGNAKIIRSVNPALDREAMRLMSIMPKWNPATREGKRIQQRMTVPIIFKLD